MVISVSNHKGGVGKTTSVLNIGAGLALKKKKVLLVDLDPQTNLTLSLGVGEVEKNTYSLLTRSETPEVFGIKKNLDLIPSSINLSGAEVELSSKVGREYVLKEKLSGVIDNYDIVLIDCPPSLGLLTVNALTASDYILIPLQAQFLATQGLMKLTEVIEMVKKYLNDSLELLGVFVTYYDKRKILNRDVRAFVETNFGDKFFNSTIRNNISLAESPASGKDIFDYAPKSNGAEDYKELIKELNKKINKIERKK